MQFDAQLLIHTIHFAQDGQFKCQRVQANNVATAAAAAVVGTGQRAQQHGLTPGRLQRNAQPNDDDDEPLRESESGAEPGDADEDEEQLLEEEEEEDLEVDAGRRQLASGSIGRPLESNYLDEAPAVAGGDLIESGAGDAVANRQRRKHRRAGAPERSRRSYKLNPLKTAHPHKWPSSRTN